MIPMTIQEEYHEKAADMAMEIAKECRDSGCTIMTFRNPKTMITQYTVIKDGWTLRCSYGDDVFEGLKLLGKLSHLSVITIAEEMTLAYHGEEPIVIKAKYI